MSKGSVYLNIPGIGRVITIWDEVLFKLRLSFDVMVTRKEFFLEYSHHSEAQLDVVIEVLKIHISVSFEFYLDEDLIEFW